MVAEGIAGISVGALYQEWWSSPTPLGLFGTGDEPQVRYVLDGGP